MSIIENMPESIIEAYVFANTPSYLFRKMITNDFIRKITLLEKEELYKFIIDSKSNDIKSIVLGYASLLALLYQGDNREKIIKISNNSLKWAEQIIYLYMEKMPSVSVSVFKYPNVENGHIQKTDMPIPRHSITIRVS